MNKIIFPSVFLIALFLTACSSQSSPAGVANSASNSNAKNPFAVYDIASGPSLPSFRSEQPEPVRPVLPGGGGGGGAKTDPSTSGIKDLNFSLNQATSSQENSIPADRKIIRDAKLGIESDRPEELQQRISAIAQNKGGFVIASEQSNSDPKLRSYDIVEMSVRVPTEKFTETIDEIKTGPGRVIAEVIKGQDVTEEFIDIDARLRAKKALEQQFLEIMKRADTVEDALSVQSELSEVRSEIEKIEGRLRFIENQSSLSTISVRIQTPAVFAAETAGFLDRLAESFGDGAGVAVNFVLGLVTFVVGILPFALFVGLPGYFLARSIFRRRNRPMSFSEIAKDEIKAE